ncbi:MAG: MCP four helix bundle domain-containing protein, partial [candidate division NC10 bacterium]|nr:MCP four helix bundle domain-containing protein [candidate division NC10 bacterium]
MAGPGKFKGLQSTLFPQEVRSILLFAFCLLLLLFLSLGLFSLQQASEVNRRTHLIVENYRKGSQAFSRLGNFTFEVDVIVQEQARATHRRTREEWASRLGQTKAEIDSFIADHLRTSVNSEERQAWEELQRGVEDYWKILQGVVALFRGQRSGGEAVSLSDPRILSGQRRLRAEREKLFLLYEQAALH